MGWEAIYDDFHLFTDGVQMKDGELIGCQNPSRGDAFGCLNCVAVCHRKNGFTTCQCFMIVNRLLRVQRFQTQILSIQK